MNKHQHDPERSVQVFLKKNLDYKINILFTPLMYFCVSVHVVVWRTLWAVRRGVPILSAQLLNGIFFITTQCLSEELLNFCFFSLTPPGSSCRTFHHPSCGRVRSSRSCWDLLIPQECSSHVHHGSTRYCTTSKPCKQSQHQQQINFTINPEHKTTL